MFQTSIRRLPRLTRHRVTLALFTFPLLLILLSAFILLDSYRPTAAHAAGGFVTRSGTQFMLDGAPFQFAGSNNYYPEYQPRAMVDDLFSNAQAMGLKVMRVWAFLDIGSLDGSTRRTIDGTKNNVYFQFWDTTTNAPSVNTGANGLQMLDYVVASAQAHNIKLIMPFTNNWRDFGGIDQYDAWYNLAFHDSFYTDANTQATFKHWINTLVNRVNSITGVVYKNDPTIMAWELANEPRCKGSGVFPPSSSCTTTTITNWANTMSTYVKSLDANHLVSVGDEGFFNRGGSDWPYAGGEGVDDAALAALPNVDFITYHLYPQDWGETFAWGTQWINDHIALGNQANKPTLLEEFGIKNDPSDRTTFYQQWLDTVCTGHGDWSYWILSARQSDANGNFTGLYPDFDGYTVYYHDANGNVTTDGAAMATQAARFTSGQCSGSSSTPTPTATATRTPTPTPTSSPTATPTPPSGNGVTVTASVAPGASNWFAEEDVRVSNTAPITALTITITVQKTAGVSFNGMYNTLGSPITMTHTDNGSAVVYTFTLNSGQTLAAGTDKLFAAQFNGNGTPHATTGDTYTVTATSNGVTTTLSGHF